VVLLTVFTLIEFANIRIKASQGGKSDKLINKFSGLGADLRKYISITALSGFFGAIGQLILMLILGVDFPVMWAFLSFLFNFIPNIGFFLTLIGPAILALLELGWISCLILIVGFVIINGLFDNVIKPKFVGKEFNMSILTIFLSLLFWSWVLGAIGAILSVPLTITVKRIWEILNENENDSDEPFKPPED
jgi:predicted PurR-regulated permease PerM